MTETRPRRLVHRGSVLVAALLLDRDAVGEDAARRRILELWRPGASLRAWERRYLLTLAEPRRVLASACLGAPLVARDGALLAAPLTAPELAAIAPPRGAVVLVRGGGARVVRRAEMTGVDPSEWVDLSGYEVLRCAAIEPPPAPAVEAIGAPPVDASATLAAAVGEAVSGRAAVLAALKEAIGGSGEGGSGEAEAGGAAGGAIGAAAGGLGDLGQGSGGAGGEPLGPAPPRARGWLDRMMDRVWETLNPGRFAGLGRWLGRKHAAYLTDLMSRLEDGDLDEALRRAVPLGGGGGGGGVRPPLTTPKRRADLSLSAGAPGSGSSLGLDVSLYERLQGLYRDAFTKLDRAGRVEEAAFVLLELLNEVEEAVAYLESRDRFELAAAIAEGRGLAPERVVRLWWLAGELERAVALARLHGAFAGAVARLAEQHPEAADSLRLLWSRNLARSGRYLQAVEVLGIKRAPDALLRSALGAGGAAAATLAGRLVGARPELLEQVRPLIVSALRDASPARARERVALYVALADSDTAAPEAAPLLRLATRACAMDLGAGVVRPTGAQLAALARLTGDDALRLDVDRLPRAQPLSAPATLAVTGREGLAGVHDAARLADGAVVVACGDAGVRVLGPGARHLDVPAHRLVVADSGNRIIAAARRGGDWQLHKINTESWDVTRWRTTRLDTFADTYDGDRWFIAEQDAVVAIDALSDEWRSLWRVDKLGSTPGVSHVELLSARGDLSFLVDDLTGPDEGLGWWSYELSSLTLRRRESLEVPQDEVWGRQTRTLSIARGVACRVSESEGRVLLSRTPGGTLTVSLGELPGVLRELWVSPDGWGAITFATEGEGDCIVILRTDSAAVVLTVALGAAAMNLRWQGERLVIADTLGRVSVVDVRQGLLESVRST